MNRRRRRSNPLVITALVVFIIVFVYIDRVIVPETPPLFVPTPTATRQPESYVVDAENYSAEGKLRQAVDSYQLAIHADPTNAANYIAIARLQMFIGDYPAAKENAEKALLINPSNALAMAVRGWAQGRADPPDFLAAEATLKQALDLDPNNALAHAYLAEILALEYENEVGSVDIDEAIEESRKARDLNPDLLEVHRVRGYIHFLVQEYSEAIDEYKAAIAINPNISDLHISLGMTYRSLDPPNYEEAIGEYERAFSLNPESGYANYLSSRAYLSWGEYVRAVQYAEDSVETEPGNALYRANLGSALYKNEEFYKAVDALRLAIRGGTAEDGTVVEGIPLSNDLRTIEFYSRYGLALANVNECSEALQIAQAMMDALRDDETAIFNAQTMIDICQANLNGTPTPEPGSETPEAGSETPEAEITPTP
ncbi:MAG TPA: tetratricopeptide repeat protein [Anaerolineaceae bacterium]|nr:tetratricopeptide repeat protein [Anaerolineaceae bacterium]